MIPGKAGHKSSPKPNHSNRGIAPLCISVLLLCLTLVFASPVTAQHDPPPGTEAPTQQERNVWNAKIGRLQANTDDMPQSIDSALASLTRTVTVDFPCPPNCYVGNVLINNVTVKITTALVKWDDDDGRKGKAGYYQWNHVGAVDGEEGVKTITCKNWVMLNPEITSKDEDDEIGMGFLADETLAYHELLHCQLLINQMLDKDWQKDACICQFNPDAQDADHSVIPAKEDGYVQQRGNDKGVNATVVRVNPGFAKADGTFEWFIPHIQMEPKEFLAYYPIIPPGGNVQITKIKDLNGLISVRGKLVDKTKKGVFYLRIDPPDEWFIVGIEDPVVVLPHGSAIPTLTEWGAIILGILFMGGIVWFVWRNKRNLATAGT